MIDQPLRHAGETTAGAVVASSYFWLHQVNEIVGALAGLAGLVYMILKIVQVIRELRGPPLRSAVLVALIAASAPACADDPRETHESVGIEALAPDDAVPCFVEAMGV